MKRKRTNYQKLTHVGACLGVVMGGALAHGATLDQLSQENQELKTRLDALETLAQKEGLLPSGTPAPRLVSAMSDITISGFVQASYFYNTQHPADGYSDAYLWNTKDNSFSLNKIKLTIASKPVERSGDEWGAGFRTSLMWGEDTPNLNTGSPNAGFEAVREAYVEVNAPVGTGLNIKAGQLISLLNWESGDGGAANPNFSQGNQWWFTGNGPSAGVQLGYTFSDKVDLKVRVQNGLFAGPVDSNQGKAFLGSLGLKPNSKTWVNLIGWFDDQGGGTDCAGFSTIGGYKVSDKLGTGWEFDYFNFSAPGNSSDLWSIGGWAWYDFTSKVGLAFRADFIDSPDGVLGPAVRPGAGITTPDADGNLASFTLTLNLKPAPNIKIQPEVRYDTTSYTGGLDGDKGRFILGAGVSYLF
ncbi:MAG TPA: outer membrane beta-barrel protein [Verrucomicrobiae bacterium]|nr:outer membrane beta-barrel protein [Verrucomicrobiae bacterium]